MVKKQIGLAKMDKTTQISDNNLYFNKHIEKCLSMVFHHEQVQQIVEVIKKVQKEYISNKETQDQEP